MLAIGTLRVGVARGEHLARLAVHDEVRARVDGRRRGGERRRRDGERREHEQEQPSVAPSYQPETAQISSRSRAASAPAAVLQSPPRARNA